MHSIQSQPGMMQFLAKATPLVSPTWRVKPTLYHNIPKDIISEVIEHVLPNGNPCIKESKSITTKDETQDLPELMEASGETFIEPPRPKGKGLRHWIQIALGDQHVCRGTGFFTGGRALCSVWL